MVRKLKTWLVLVALAAGCATVDLREPGTPGQAALRATGPAGEAFPPAAVGAATALPEVTLELAGDQVLGNQGAGAAGAGSPVAGSPRAIVPLPPGWGVLTMVVKWPARRVAAIPASTRVIRVEVLEGVTVLQVDGQDLASEVSRQEGAATASATVRVPAGGPYQVRVRAYKDPVARDSSSLVAEGTAASVSVVANKALDLAVTLTPVGNAPVVDALVPTNGGPGTILLIVGKEFGSPGDPLPTLTLSGLQAPVSLVLADDPAGQSTISVTVPAAAGTGQVVVTRDTFTNAAPPTFTVLQSLSFVASVSALTAPATFGFTAAAIASPSGQAVANPAVGWAVFDLTDGEPPDPPIAEIAANGVLTARAPGSVEVAATSGDLVATVSVTLQ